MIFIFKMGFISDFVQNLTPFRKPKLKPITWNLAVKKAEKKELPYINYRELCVKEDYENSKKEIAKHWDSAGSHIKHYVFGMPYKVLHKDDKMKAVCSVQEPLKGMLK